MILPFQVLVKLVLPKYSKMVNLKLPTYIGYAPIKDPQLAFSLVYTNQPVPEPWLNGGDVGRDVIDYYLK